MTTESLLVLSIISVLFLGVVLFDADLPFPPDDYDDEGSQ